MTDARSRTLVFVAHCLLNQNAKVAGLAAYRGVLEPIASLLCRSGVGIIQMPCPEMTHLGPSRPLGTDTYEQYDRLDYREVCERIAEQVVAEIAKYRRAGYVVACVLGVDGSPSCAAEFVPRLVPAAQRVLVPGRGVFIETLCSRLRQAELEIPIVGIPEADEAGNLKDALAFVERIVAQKGCQTRT